MNIIVRRLAAFIVSLCLIFAPAMSYAASPAGWTATAANTVMSGATATITAFKSSSSGALKSVITHAPTAVAVGKNVVRLGSGVAIAYALSEILGEGVDWVMDPANNSVIYTADSDTCDGNSCQYLWSSVQNNSAYATYQTPQAAGTAACSIINGYERLLKVVYGRDDTYWIDCTGSSGNTRRAVSRHANPNYDPDAPTTEEKYIPISDVSAKVIANAEAGHAESQDFVKSVAVGAVESGELDAGLDAVAEPTTDSPTTDSPTADPDSPSFDPSSIISAIQSLSDIFSSQFQDLMNVLGLNSQAEIDAINVAAADAKTAAADAKTAADAELKDWVMTDAPPTPTDTDTALDIDVPNVIPVDTDINFGGSCPANFEVNSSIFGNPINITLFDSSKFCSFLSTFVKFPVYASSSLFALYILGGRKDV